MAESNFERFQKMYPKKSDIPMLANPAPMPGPGGIVKKGIQKGIQSGIRRFSTPNSGAATKMKDRGGLGKDTVKKKDATSGTKTDRMRDVKDPKGPTKMKDRKGLERKPDPKPANQARTFGDKGGPTKSTGRSTGQKVAAAGVATGAVVGGYYGSKGLSEARKNVANDRKVQTNQQVRDSSYKQTNPTQRPYDASTSPKPKGFVKASGDPSAPKPKARPADLKKPGKSKTRIAFEKEFAKARREGKKEFKFKGGKYNTKLAK
jgi:hypothetical protein